MGYLNYRIVYVEDMDGEHPPGWVLARFPWADPVSVKNTSDLNEVLGLAHDILEHSPTDSGLYCEEIMAFGAMFWTRAFTPYLYPRSNLPLGVDLGRELGNTTVYKWMVEGYSYPVHRKFSDEPPRHWLKVEDRDVVSKRWSEMKNAANTSVEVALENGDLDLTEDEITACKEGVLTMLDCGYSCVERRFKNQDFSGDLLWEMVSCELQTCIEVAEGRIGEAFTLMIDKDAGHVTSSWSQGTDHQVDYRALNRYLSRRPIV